MSVKETLADIGIDTLMEFCEANRIKQPTLHIIKEKDHEICVRIKRVGTCGYYRLNNIYVGVPLCAHQNPNYSWAAYISDRTPFGVIQHELGHYVDELRSAKPNIYQSRTSNFSDTVRAASKEPAITSYSPNTMEWFAEIFRLYVTNPDLLKLIRPRAYDALYISGLMPIEERSYKEVLEQFGAPPRIFDRLSKLQK